MDIPPSIICWILLSNYFVVSHQAAGITLLLQQDVTDTDSSGADVVFVERSHRWRRNPRELPPDLEIVIGIHDDSVHLGLERTAHLDSPALLSTIDNGRLRQKEEFLTQGFYFYQDVQNGASMTIHASESKQLDGTEITRFLEGYFLYNGSIYYICPTHQPGRSAYSDKAGRGLHNHRIFQMNKFINFGQDDVYNNPAFQPKRGRPPHSVQKRQVTSAVTYEVELMLITDYSMYKFWLDQTQNETQAETLLRRYCAFLVNSVDLRYRSIGDSDLNYRVKLSGLYITKTEEESAWTEGNKTSSGSGDARPTIEGEEVLNSLNHWLNQDNQSSFQHFDHVMLLTRYDMQTRSGLAIEGAICTIISTSVVENNFDFAGAIISTHELGHSLGAVHDGVNNTCNGTDGYIMAAQFNPADVTIGTNPWHFSPCTLTDFRKKLEELNRSENCLLVRNKADDPITPPNTLFGQLYDVDKQCQMSFGDQYYFCRVEEPYVNTCARMKCCKFNYPDYQFHYMIAGRGTLCGDKKWCIDGECVNDTSAPSVDGLCPFDDYPGIVQNGENCSEIVTAEPSVCYTPEFRLLCCHSCATHCTGSPGCECGDKDVDCKTLSKHRCYDHSETCCEFCQPVNVTGCEFGDKDVSCFSSSFQRQECYMKNETCCGTCATMKNESIPDCPYGDRPGCRSDLVNPCDCLEQSMAYSCCQSCKTLPKPALEDCQCFDKVSTCSGIKNFGCYNQTIREICCKTCRDFKDKVANITQGPCQDCEYGNKQPDSICEKLTKNKALCYNSDNAENCCLTCCSVRNTSLTGCEFGDKYAWCNRTDFVRSNCYYSEADCCETCPPLKNSSAAGCEFGDKDEQCNGPNFARRGCYDKTIESKCCDSCAILKNETFPGCSYGDRYNCTMLTDTACYQNNVFSDQCCESCIQRLDCSKPGCEFGDQVPDCTVNHCVDFPTKCCGTCWDSHPSYYNFTSQEIFVVCATLSFTTQSPTILASEPSIPTSKLTTPKTKPPTTSSMTTPTTTKVTSSTPKPITKTITTAQNINTATIKSTTTKATSSTTKTPIIAQPTHKTTFKISTTKPTPTITTTTNRQISTPRDTIATPKPTPNKAQSTATTLKPSTAAPTTRTHTSTSPTPKSATTTSEPAIINTQPTTTTPNPTTSKSITTPITTTKPTTIYFDLTITGSTTERTKPTTIASDTTTLKSTTTTTKPTTIASDTTTTKPITTKPIITKSTTITPLSVTTIRTPNPTAPTSSIAIPKPATTTPKSTRTTPKPESTTFKPTTPRTKLKTTPLKNTTPTQTSKVIEGKSTSLVPTDLTKTTHQQAPSTKRTTTTRRIIYPATTRKSTTKPIDLSSWEPLLSVPTIIGVAVGGACVLLVLLVIVGVCLLTKVGGCGEGKDWLFAPFNWGTSSSTKNLYEAGETNNTVSEERDYPTNRARPWHDNVFK